MNNYLAPNDGPTRIEKFLEEMKALFRELAQNQSKLKDDMVELRAQNADQTALRAVQDEMRTYTDSSVKEGLARVESRLDDKMANLRAALLSDVDERLKARLDEWTKDHISPLFEQLIADREEREQTKRDEMVQRWRNRLTLGTAALLFFVSMYQTFRPKPDNARDFVRPIERLSDIAG